MVRVIRRKNSFQKIGDNLHNFKLFAFLGILAIGAGLTYYLTTQQQDLRQRATSTANTEFGFNTHINAINGTGYWENLTFEYFNKTVDDLVANNQQWIRVGITPWEVITGASVDSITWNEPVLQKYAEALTYAKSKGLKVYVNTALPDYADNYTKEQYLDSNIRYHAKLSEIFKDKVTIWQIYNESDVRTFKGYKPMTLADLNQEYLDEFVINFRAVKSKIKELNPNVWFTANVSGFPISSTETDTRMNRFFDAVATELDIIALDLYPLNTSEIGLLKSVVGAFGSKYGKPVLIAETGFPTGDGRYSEADQGTLLSSTVETLKSVYPMAIIIYQYADTLPTTDRTESSFGIVKIDGTKKSSYTQIMNAMRHNQSTPTPQPTLTLPSVPPTPTLTNTPTPTPQVTTGLLRVTTSPAVAATIKVFKTSGQVVLTKQWGVDWEPLVVGTYYVSFSYPRTPGLKTPRTTSFKINLNRTTEITGNFKNGKTTVVYK